MNQRVLFVFGMVSFLWAGTYLIVNFFPGYKLSFDVAVWCSTSMAVMVSSGFWEDKK